MLPPVFGNTNVSIQSGPEYCQSCQLSRDQGGCSNAQQFERTAILGLHRRSCLQQLGNFFQPALGWAPGRLFTPSVVRHFHPVVQKYIGIPSISLLVFIRRRKHIESHVHFQATVSNIR